eukprot:CCRYP_013352-RA/>CCRYP_013352-RA protein AED:0.16 eAED:0.24 QI:0/0/0/1/0.2/0.16/6/0/1158
MSSAAEAELGALYINARRQYHNDTFSMNWDIHNLQLPYKLTTPQPLGGHQHHPTQAHQSNGHAFSLAPFFAPIGAGTTNLADYVTKHHPAIHHQAVSHIYLSTPLKLLLLQHKAHNILKSATLAPPPQQAPYMTHSSTLRPAPPKYLCYRQEPPPQPQSKHSSSSMYVRPPTQSTLYQTFTKHYSVVANSLAPTTQPCTTNTKSTSTTPPLSTSPSAQSSLAIDAHAQASGEFHSVPSLIEQSIRYLHAAAGFPTKSTWLAAIRKGNYSTWPLITVKNVHKHFPQSEETQQGHMRNQRQGTRSTKQALPQAEPRTPLPQLHDIFIRTYDTHGTLYTDQTGKFPHLSSQGNRYQMILYHVDSNSIWAEPTKNKTEGELILARNRALQRMKACGIQPTRQVLDNEISAAYKLAITASGMTYQLVPPGDHRRNIAEKAIQTWKDHFIAVISGTGAKFPLHLWCQLLPQMERQLCLLRQSNAYPTFPPIRISTAIMTTTHTLSSPGHGSPCPRQTPPPQIFCPTLHQGYITNPSVTPADAIIAAAANLSHLLTNNLQAHHNNKVNQSDLTRLQILIQPSPPPQHNATHYQQHSPNATRPSSPAAVSDYDSDSSDSDDESITIPHLVPRLPLQPPRVSPQQTMTPRPRVSAPPSSPAYNTRSRALTITQETILHLLHNTRTPLTPRRAATRQFPREALSAILDTDTGELLEYHHLIKNPKYSTIWKNAYGKELGRLAQGIPGTVKGTNTIVFIAYNEIPPQRRKDVTYGCIVANYRPEKDDPYRIRLTVGGNRITYPGHCGTPTADMLTTKILLNSHLLQTLNEHYETSQDWKGERYLGLTIAWDYTLQQVQLSMPVYCKKAGHRFHHPVPIKPQHQPYPHTPRTYCAKQQFVDTADDSALLSNTDKTFVQEVIGVFLYYARAVDCTMLPALGSLATQQSAPTQNTMSKIHQFLDYAMTHPDAMITYRASNMILAVHSDASYLSETKACSRAGGHFFLSEDDPSPRNNGAILTLAQIIKPVMSSAAEAELGALYINARETIPQRHLLNELGHPQPPTPIQIDNSTALGVVTNIIQPKRTKAMDMRFHWLRCRENQKQFCTYWRTGTTNLADYVTKHHPAIHHQAVRHIYLLTPTKLLLLRNKAHNILKVATTLPTLTPHACAA